MNNRRTALVFGAIVLLLLGLSIPLQYLVRREVVVGLASDEAHSHAHAEEGHEHDHGEDHEHEHTEEEGHLAADVPLGVNLIPNFGFEVGTLESMWGWSVKGREQGALVYRDDRLSRRGLASAAVDTRGGLVVDAGLYMGLEELPLDHDVVLEGYIKTEELYGEAYLSLIAEVKDEESEDARVLVYAYTDNVDGDSGWTHVDLSCYIPPETTGIWLEAGLYGKGRAWFDDLVLVVWEPEDRLVVGENLLLNPSFESGLKHWHLYSDAEARALEFGTLDAGQDGGRALYLRNGGPAASREESAGFLQAVRDLYGREGVLGLRGRIKCEDVQGRAWVDAIAFGKEETRVYPITGDLSGDTPWGTFEWELPLEGETACLWIRINLAGSGSVYLDDLEAVFEGD